MRNYKIQADVTKKRYSRLKNWYWVRFSDEIHFEYNLQGKLHFISKPNK